MRKIVLRASSIHVGTDAAELIEVDDDTTDEQLSDDAWQFALDNAAMYGHEPEEHMPEDMDPDCEEAENYGSVDGWWEEYNPEVHDGIL